LAERERAEDMSGEDAAWRDLVARFDLPGGPDGTAPPWPEREDLPPARHQQPRRGTEAQADTEAQAGTEAQADTEAQAGTDAPADVVPGAAVPDDAVADRVPGAAVADDAMPHAALADDAAGASAATAGTAAAGTAAAGTGTDAALADGDSSANAADAGEDQPGRSPEHGRADGRGGSEEQAAATKAGPPEPAIPDCTRVIKPAVPVQLPATDDDDEDHYIPPPPPPLPVLDPVAKGAWVALFGGPAYLLVATSAGWMLPGWATFGAVGAFVGGFAVLVIRMGDKPSRGSGPDSGAVL